MKFNFKKISAITAGVLLTGLTLGTAAAASFPAPFTSSGNGVAVVYGANADPMDQTQANSIATYLQGKIGGGVPDEGDYVLFDKGSIDHFTLGELASSIYPTLDDDELSVVLAPGVYVNDQNEEYAYTQQINIGALNLSFFRDTNYDYQPVIGFDLSDATLLANYTLDFDNAAEGGSNFDDLENTNLEILGKDFYISQVTTTANGVKMTLLDSANTAIVSEGETVSVDVDGKSYEVSINFVEDANTARLEVNGQVTNSIDEGQTYKLSDGTYVGIKDVSYNSKDTGVSQVEFSLGTGQIVIENGIEVQVNSEDVSDMEDANEYSYVVNAYITNSSTNIESINLEWLTDGDVWIAPGIDVSMPGFGAIKLSMGDFVTPAEEVTMIDDSADSVRFTTTVEDGDLSLPVLYTNNGVTAWEGLGESSTHVLVTNSTSGSHSSVALNETLNSYFVATWVSGNDAESYVFEIDKIEDESGKNKTTLKNIAGGSDVVLSEVGRTKDYGQVTFTLSSASDNGRNAVVMVAPTGSGTVYTDRVVTAEGMVFRLPVIAAASTATGALNLTVNTTQWVTTFTEEDASNNIAQGKNFTVEVGIDAADGTEVTRVDYASLDADRSSDIDVGYVPSPLATYLEFDQPSGNALNELSITYHGDDSYAQFYVSEIGATSSGAGSMVFKDSERSSWENKNVILVGGSCINSAAAQALGVPSGTCGAAFTSATGAGTGQYIIQTVDSPFTDGRVALVVAGYSAEDTKAASTKLTTSPSSIDTTVGNKYLGIVGVSGDSTVSAI